MFLPQIIAKMWRQGHYTPIVGSLRLSKAILDRLSEAKEGFHAIFGSLVDDTDEE